MQLPIITCKVDEPPRGWAVRRVYAQCGVRFVYDSPHWDLFRPTDQSLDLRQLAAMPDAAGKWFETVPEMELLASRRPLYARLKTVYGAETAARIMSETFLLNHEEDLQQLAAADPSEIFILKGPQQRRKGLRLATGAEAVTLRDRYLVAERFITDQIRFRDTTFHLRCYLLLTMTPQTLTTWLFEDTICGWAIPSQEAGDMFQEWVTHPDNEVPNDYPCSMSQLCDALGLPFETTWWSIAEAIVDTVRCCAPPTGRMQLPDAVYFQHFGFDVVLRSDGTPSLCEINKGPEMDARNPRYAAIKDKVLRDGLVAAGVMYDEPHGFVKIFEQKI